MSASLATGALRHALSVRKDDCYETPIEAVRALIRIERIPRKFWEPACGPGAIVELTETGFQATVRYSLPSARNQVHAAHIGLVWAPAESKRGVAA